ncbi:MAG: SIMPL domain-containing protein [Gammaproteobacteria bacterium]|nr:SIMPL domain-containing protein [Gammaproteobacteria bacterium]
MNGTGFASVAPDRATLQMSIVAREPTLAAAQEAAAAVTNKVLEMTDRMDIDRDQVDTTGASVRPDYRWNRQKEEQELRGYIAERRISVEVEDLEKLGVVVEGAVDAGVNQVSPPQLDSSKRKATYRQALSAAARDAKANALQLTDALGAELGPVISINSGSSEPRPPVPFPAGVRAMAVEADAVESYNAADLGFNAAVTVVFQLQE